MKMTLSRDEAVGVNLQSLEALEQKKMFLPPPPLFVLKNISSHVSPVYFLQRKIFSFISRFCFVPSVSAVLFGDCVKKLSKFDVLFFFLVLVPVDRNICCCFSHREVQKLCVALATLWGDAARRDRVPLATLVAIVSPTWI